MLRFLLQEGPDAPKHKGRTHPIITFVLHYVVVTSSVFLAHDALVDIEYSRLGKSEEKECAISSEMMWRRQIVGRCLAAYFLLYFCIRLALQWNTRPQYLFYSEFYQQTFMCSVTIFNSALGFCYHRPIVSQAFCLAVGIDQLMWYFDIVGFFLLGDFPIGVCKYLFKPGSNWINRITSGHHLWTIPLVLWVSGGVFHWIALPLSFVLVPVSICISHFMTPFAIRTSNKNDGQDLYLNVNLSHGMWADVKLKMFLIGERQLPYALRLICWWYLFNVLMYAMINGISNVVLGGSNPSIC